MFNRVYNHLEEDDIKSINESDLIIIKTNTDNHLAYYNNEKKAYYLICNYHFNAQHLAYSDFYDRKKGVCYKCRFKFNSYNKDLKYKKIYEKLFSNEKETQKKVSIRCCVKTMKGKRCKLYSNTHGSFCRMHYDKLINIMSRRIPKEIVMSIMNL